MSNSPLIRHLLGSSVTVIDGRKPVAAYPRYIGTLRYTGRRGNRYYVAGVDFHFRLSQVVKVEGSTITLGNPYRVQPQVLTVDLSPVSMA